MSNAPLDEIEVRNREALEELAQSIAWSVGEFHLFVARCNYGSVRSHLIERLLEICPVAIEVITLKATTEKLYTHIREELGDKNLDAVLVVGFEHIKDLDQLFAAADSAREEFRKNLPFPLVLWLDDDQFNRFRNRAPNFASWVSVGIPVFAIAPIAILNALEQGRRAVMKAAFDPANTDLPDAIHHITYLGDLHRSELPHALQLLEDQGIGLWPDLQADLDFIQGCALSYSNSSTDLDAIDAALEHFQDSITYYRIYLPTLLPDCVTPPHIIPANLKLALNLFFRGRCQFQRIDLARRRNDLPYSQEDWDAPRASLVEAVQLFDQCDRPDMTAKVILRLAHTLRRLEDWDALEAVAQRAIPLHTTYHMPLRMGEPYGFLAEVALHRQQWSQGWDYAQQALEAIAPLPLAAQWSEGLYLTFQAKASEKMGRGAEAIALLERARELGDRGHPTTYCRILEALRELYRQQKRYLDAFKLKQARLEVEKIAGIRAFVGAGRLGAQARLLMESNNPDDLAPEIRASGRQLDLQRLLERIGRNDYKLTVIYGSSGVGKSSLMNAGLIPTLKGRAIGTRDNRVVLVRKYMDWLENLWNGMKEVLGSGDILGRSPLSPPLERGEAEPSGSPPFQGGLGGSPDDATFMTEILQGLQECDRRNLRPILIFDQFEEFFFANPNPLDRRRFFQFLGDCLQIPFINVILSLREDYLHFLLEANKVAGMGAIGSDILSNQVLYGLGNFPPQDAKAIIEDLTGRSRLSLEPALIDALVDDLAGELREVRPIELQVVGSQLETEKISTLSDYRALGFKPKEELVTRYLQDVVEDCGEEYAPLAARVLYELTDERGTRPLKTYLELQQGLEAVNFPMPGYPVSPCGDPLATGKDSLDYVLRMLAGSGIVVYLPEQPNDRYQLIHDYIAETVRKKYPPNTAAELAAERKKRLTAESLLKIAQGKNQKAQRRVALASGVLAASLVISGVVVSVAMKERHIAQKEAEIERDSSRLYTWFDRNAPPTSTKVRVGQLESLVAAIRLGEALQTLLPPQPTLADYPTVSPVLGLQQQLLRRQEANRFEHDSAVYSVSFSPDGQQILTGSDDGTATLWRADGQQLQQFQHESEVWSVSFSPDGQQILTGSDDGTATLWRADGQQLQQFQHEGAVYSVSFSPNGQQILTGSRDDTATLWRADGKQLQQFQHDSEVWSVSFSPDGQQILTGSRDGIATLWRADGQQLQQFQHDSAVRSVSFSPDGQQILTGSWDGTVALWRADGQQLRQFQHDSVVSSVSFSPNGQQILTGSRDGIATLWRADGQQLQQFQHEGAVLSVSFSPDEQQILIGSFDDTATLWHADGQQLQQFQHEGAVYSVSFSPNGQQVLTGSRNGKATLWRADGQQLQQFQHEGAVYSVSFSPDGQQILTGSRDGTATRWRADGQQLQQFQHESEVWSVSFSPDGQQILTGSFDGTATLWRADGQQLQQFQHEGAVYSVSFSPDGQQILTGSEDSTATLWRADGQQLQRFQHDSEVLSVSFSPDGQQILTGSQDGTATLWRADGQQLQQFQHDRAVWNVSFSPDGQQILTGSRDGTATLWRADGQKLQHFQHDSAVRSISFSPNGQQILTGSDDGTATLYPVLTLDDMIEMACDRLSNFLTYNPTVSDSDRALCNIPPRGDTGEGRSQVGGERSQNPVDRLIGFLWGWMRA